MKKDETKQSQTLQWLVTEYAEDYAKRLADAQFTMQEARFIQYAVQKMFEEDCGIELKGALLLKFKECFWKKFNQHNRVASYQTA
jgi:hypothetical protein